MVLVVIISKSHIDSFKQLQFRELRFQELKSLLNFISDSVVVLKDDSIKFSNSSFQKEFNINKENLDKFLNKKAFKYQLKLNDEEEGRKSEFSGSDLISLHEISFKFKNQFDDYIFVFVNQEDELVINQKIFEIKIEHVQQDLIN